MERCRYFKLYWFRANIWPALFARWIAKWMGTGCQESDNCTTEHHHAIPIPIAIRTTGMIFNTLYCILSTFNALTINVFEV